MTADGDLPTASAKGLGADIVIQIEEWKKRREQREYQGELL